MTWIALLVVAVILIVMSLRYPRIAFSLLGVLLVAGVIVYRLTGGDQNSKPIAAELLTLENLHMSKSYGDSYYLAGRIRNRSDRALREFSLLVQALDCPRANDDQDCQIIGEKTVSIYSKVPPKQARDFRENIYLGQLQPAHILVWRHQLY